jgi:hypothetical protein
MDSYLTPTYLTSFVRFYPSAAKTIADKILAEELNGQVFDEEEAKTWSLNISDKVREAVHGRPDHSADFFLCICITLLFASNITSALALALADITCLSPVPNTREPQHVAI